MKIINNRVAAVIGGAVVLATLSGTGGAFAARLITSADIRDGAVHRVDLSDGVNTALARHAQDGQDGKNGKPGISNLIVGAGYAGLGAHDYWAPHSYGETIETCPAGQNAIGGGYSQDASTGSDGKYDLGGKADVQITVSAPYFKGDYVPVDDAGNFRADQWVVRGYNNGDTQVDVRAWVVCANVAK
jgi:hypothetical protein